MFVWSLIKKNGKTRRNVLISGAAFILMSFLIVIDSDASETSEVVSENSENEEVEKEKAEKEKAEKEKAEKEKAEKEKAEKEKAEKEKAEKEKAEKEKESHADISSEDIIIDDITTKIEEGILTIKFRSYNQSGDLAVLDGLVTVTAEQDNDFLDEAFDLYDPDAENSYSHWIEDSTSY